jgi:hypothetical protein
MERWAGFRTVSSKNDESAIAMKVSPGWNLPVYTNPQLDKIYSHSALFQLIYEKLFKGGKGYFGLIGWRSWAKDLPGVF